MTLPLIKKRQKLAVDKKLVKQSSPFDYVCSLEFRIIQSNVQTLQALRCNNWQLGQQNQTRLSSQTNPRLRKQKKLGYYPPVAETKVTGIAVLNAATNQSPLLCKAAFLSSGVPLNGGPGGAAARLADAASVLQLRSVCHPDCSREGRFQYRLRSNTMKPDLPQVLQFSHLYDVKLETNSNGLTEVKAVLKAKHQPNYKRGCDLPYVFRDTVNNRIIWFSSPKSDNWSEQKERAQYYWNEFVRFARGPQKKRRGDATNHLSSVLFDLWRATDCKQESTFFAEHVADAVIAHLRVGLDEGKSDQQIRADEVAA